MEYILNLSAVLAHIIEEHPKHRKIEDKLSKATRMIIPDLIIIELQWVVQSGRHPEIDEEVFSKILGTIRTDPAVSLEKVSPEVAIQQRKWYKRLSFFDAYYAAFSMILGVKLLTTDTDFEGLDFAEVV